MRILVLHRRRTLSGGAEAIVHELNRGLLERGHEVVLAHADDPRDAEPLAASETLRLPRLLEDRDRVPREGEAERRREAELLRGARADVLIVHNLLNGAGLRAALSAGRVVRVVHDHETACPSGDRLLDDGRACAALPGRECVRSGTRVGCARLRPGRRAKNLRRSRRRLRYLRLHRRCARVLCISAHLRDLLVAGGLDPSRVEVLPVPVRAPPDSQDGAATPRGDYVAAGGRLDGSKGMDLLLRAFTWLPSDARLRILGDGGQRERLLELREGLGLRSRVEVEPWLPPAQFQRALASARIVAMPSRWPEPFGLVAAEALASGVPVVASAVGGIPEWLEDGVTGLLVPPEDPRALGEALARLWSDGDLRARMGAAGRARFAGSGVAAVERLLAVLEAVRSEG